ncbi:MAG: discoidin domain-containing protein, partial [Chitinophagaceae bacterium]
HRFNTMSNYNIAGNLRQVAIDELVFNPNVGIQHVVTTHKGTLPSVEGERKNVAFGAKVQSSSDLDSITKASYINDENNGTLWIGGKKDQAWVSIDLGSVLPVQRIEIFVEYPIYAYAYKLEISDNGKIWKTVDDQMENKKIGSPMFLDKKLNARFVKVTMPNKKGTPRPGIWELKVY